MGIYKTTRATSEVVVNEEPVFEKENSAPKLFSVSTTRSKKLTLHSTRFGQNDLTVIITVIM